MRRLILAAGLLVGLAPLAHAQTLVSYYNFNNAAAEAPSYPTPIAPTQGAGSIVYDFDTNATFAGSTLNARNSDVAGGSLVFQGAPGGTGTEVTQNGRFFEVRFASTGLENIEMRFATRGTSSGFSDAAVTLSTDGGATFTSVATLSDLRNTTFNLRTLPLPAAANNVADVRVRFTLTGATTAGGNNRYDNITVEGTPAGAPPPTETASVSFDPTSTTVTEGQSTNLTIAYALADTDGNDANNPAVSGTVVVTSANPEQVSFTGSFSFPAGTLAGATTTIAVTAVNDGVFTGTRQVVFGFDGVTGGTASGTFTLTITDDETPPPPPTLVFINEFDADTPGTDAAEFVELLGPANTSLSGLVLVFFNGNQAVNGSYAAYSLDGQTTGADGLFVLCGSAAEVSGCDLVVSPATNLIQNGGPADAIALYTGTPADFPANTPPTQVGLVDAVVYNSTSTVLDPELASALGVRVTFFENVNGAVQTQSLARLNTAAGPSELFYAVAPTPGAANPATLDVAARGLDAGAGWRQLGVPAVQPTGQPFDVGTLAGLNLVQGVPAGTVNPAQYPLATSNVLSGYDGSGTSAGFTTPATTDQALAPGQGFFWVLYDEAITPDPGSFGGGTSVSVPIAGFNLAVTGVPVDDRLNSGPYAQTMTNRADGAYLLANPFAYPVALAGLTASAGTLSTNFSVWNPAAGGSYETVTNAGTLPVWQGVFAEVTGAAGPVTFTLSSDNVQPAASNNVIGRSAAEPRLALRLAGLLADGTEVSDRAALVRFLDDATDGWDRHDGSKQQTPLDQFALVAFTGDRNGETVAQAVRSLAPTFDAARVLPVAFRATQAGTYSLTWERTALPNGVQAELRDLATGTVTNLATASSYAFSADASADWATRFELVVGNSLVASEGAPQALRVSALFPNPATDRAALTVQVDAAQTLSVRAYDALGRQVAVLFDGVLAAGAEQTLALPTAGLAPGVYVVRVEGESFAETRRLTVVR